MRDDVAAELLVGIPRIPASASSLIFDAAGRLLILKPNYKKGWTLPGGQIEPTGESPWEACRRETREECGLEVTRGRLACVDFLRPKRDRPGGVRFLFDCGALTERQRQAITLQDEEIDEYRLADLTEAAALLSGPIRRRVAASVGAGQCVYLEEGRPVFGMH
jgi:8-oxo-dGTP diphosphatase